MKKKSISIPSDLPHRSNSINSIKNYRKRIDEVDKKILQLLTRRAELAIEVGNIKEGLSQTIYNPEREKHILNRMSLLNAKHDSPLSPSSVKAVFTEIISTCRSLEHTSKVAYLGPNGSFSHLAALKQFGSSVELLPQHSINASFELLKRRHCDYAVLPIENSIEGMVNNTIDQLSLHEFYIQAELFLPIRLCLFINKKLAPINNNSPLSQAGKDRIFSRIKTLYSHPQPFGQARDWIEKHLSKVKLSETHSTSHAAEECLKKRSHTKKTDISACIGSEQLLKVFPELRMIEERIEDGTKNTTRFVVITPKLRVIEGANNITSLLITIKDKPGALYNILSAFAKSKINLTNLVSRPSKRKAFDYLFYIDFEGNIHESRVQKVLKKIKPYIVEVKIIGSYLRGTFF